MGLLQKTACPMQLVLPNCIAAGVVELVNETGIGNVSPTCDEHSCFIICLYLSYEIGHVNPIIDERRRQEDACFCRATGAKLVVVSLRVA